MKNKISTILLQLMCILSLSATETLSGFIDFTWSEETGKVILKLRQDQLNTEFLYVNSLAAGVGSNDIGLDRGQLGGTRIVKFIRTGEKLLLIQPNFDFRANSDNPLERKAVEEAFAQSVIWGFKINDPSKDTLSIDLTPFLLRDAHNVIGRLKNSHQGSYKLDASRSAIWKPNTLNFPENSEFESILSFTGQATGSFIRSVAPSPDAITVRQHHSFIKLPDNNYRPRVYHPYSGYNAMSYYDYATPIHKPIQKKFIARHRLKKKNPSAKQSEALEPITYYIDPGCPEPIKSALMEGATWWNQAFEATGYINAFQVKELPKGAHPLDVRYNMIQWVHRSTRGWSYGSSVRDPRTGEIIKGHVSLGSLRVRQDFMIAQGLLSPFGQNDENHTRMTQLALARLRQLAAHEVGHTIGLSHNFASSFNNRASVMDYPHPFVQLDNNGNLDFSSVYDDKIGEWDKRIILYGYQDFTDEMEEQKELNQIISDTQKMGLHYISDRDSRPQGGANPMGHLWDNGADPIAEMYNKMEIRKVALNRFGENSISSGTPLSELEKVLVPVYLFHRYQIEAVSKLIGGVKYSYSVKGDALDHLVTPVDVLEQERALQALLSALNPKELKLPTSIISLIPPSAQGFSRNRESFSSNTGLTFDPLAIAESLSNHTISFMLNSQRLSRIVREPHNSLFNNRLGSYLNTISESLFEVKSDDSYEVQLHLVNQHIYFNQLLKLMSDEKVDHLVSAIIKRELDHILNSFLSSTNSGSIISAHSQYLLSLYDRAVKDPSSFKVAKLFEMPPGAPIGCGEVTLNDE